jgi:hypothetical protein
MTARRKTMKSLHHPRFAGIVACYDPRASGPVMQAFEAAEDDVLKNTVKGGSRLGIPEQFASSYLADVEKAYPEYFNDLPALPR